MTELTENNLVERLCIALFQTLGWETLNAFHEFEQAGGSPLGRETRSEVVLAARLRSSSLHWTFVYVSELDINTGQEVT